MSTEAVKGRPAPPTQPGAAESHKPTRAAAEQTEAGPARRFTPEQQRAWMKVMMDGVKLMGTKGVSRRVSALVPRSAGPTHHTTSGVLGLTWQRAVESLDTRASASGVPPPPPKEDGISHHGRWL